MSIASYRRNEQRGVTGPYLPTCFPAALEQVSPNHAFPPTVYEEYCEYLEWARRYNRAARNAMQEDDALVITSMVRHLGGLEWHDLKYKRANTAIGLKRIIHKLLETDHHVLVDIDQRSWHTSHTIGLIPVQGDFFAAVSNQVPAKLTGLVTLDDIAARLAQSTDPYMAAYPFNNANITGLPIAA